MTRRIDPTGPDFDPAVAMALLTEQQRRIRSAFDVRLHESLAAWGLAWLVGPGGVWLQVRNQHPYEGPRGLTAAAFAGLLLLAGAHTAWRTVQATRGIGGPAGWRGAVYGARWGGGFLVLFSMLSAFARAGAPHEVTGTLGTCDALLVVGLMYLCGAALWGVRPMAALGGWLLALAVVAAFSFPVTAALLAAVLGGGGFLITAGWLWLRHGAGRADRDE